MRSFSRASTALLSTRFALCAALLTAGCTDVIAPPTAPDPEGLRVTSRIDCVGSITTREVRCADAAPATVTLPDGTEPGMRITAPMRDVILGNQGGYVRLTSSNVSAVAGVFSFDVTVQNKITQTIGTTTGSNVAPSGIRIFFASGPTATGGTMDFDNGAGGFYYDGVNTFTASNQPYFQYNERLVSGATSSAKTWKLRYDATVTTFAFTLYVSAPVQYQDGYINGNAKVVTVNYGEKSSSIGGTVRSPVNNVMGGTITYTSLDPSVATVDATGAVTGGSARGITYIKLDSGSIPNLYKTAVNVCASTPTISSGASVSGTIDASDCYSGFASSQELPDPTYLSDMFRVALTAGQQVSISLTSDGSFSPFLTLVDPSGVIEKTGTGGVGTTKSIPAYAVLRTGVYIIEAGQENVTLGGGYTLNFSILP
jgi:hypothetical protein